MANSLGGTYTTGTISTDTGSPADPRLIVGTGTLWEAVAEPGDWLIAEGSDGFGLIASVDSDTELTLELDWNGGALEDANYVLIKNSWLRYDPAITQAQVRKLIEALTGDQTVFYRVTGAAPDPSLGEDGDFAIKTNGGSWQQWEKVDGAWVSVGTPVGASWEGAWSSVIEYQQNDIVSDDGSTYIALTTNTDKRPSLNSNPSNPAREWDLFASIGERGIDGGVITIPLVFDGASTADNDPGAGKIRFGPGSSQRAATMWRLDPIDAEGFDWSGTISDLAAGTSIVKFKARLFKRLDQTVKIVGNVTAVATPSGYRNLTFAATDWSSDNPFTNGDEVALALDPKGDKGDQGNQGLQGIQGIQGFKGWSPVFSVVSDSARRVLQVTDWVGGESTKPSTGSYIGASGLVSLLADAVDIRGSTGQGIQPTLTVEEITSSASPAQDDRDAHDGDLAGTIVLVASEGAIYVKLSSASGDWSSAVPVSAVTSADEIEYDGSSSGLSAPYVQGAIDETVSRINALPDPIAMAIALG